MSDRPRSPAASCAALIALAVCGAAALAIAVLAPIFTEVGERDCTVLSGRPERPADSLTDDDLDALIRAVRGEQARRRDTRA